MIDFRYHALSLVAVFLALGIGIVLGVTIGDSLVSDADKSLRSSLRQDVELAREQERRAEELGSRKDAVISEVAPELGRGRLRGGQVALIGIGDLPGGVSDPVEQAVEEEAGGSLDAQTELDVGEADELAAVLGARRPGRDRKALKVLGLRLGRAIIRGGRTALALQRELPKRFRGDFEGRLDGIVVYRSEGDQPDLQAAFEDGLLEGLELSGGLVGVERLDTDPSQVGWFDDNSEFRASVDNVESAAGRLALVLALDRGSGNQAEGKFGFKNSADRPLPELDRSAP